MRFYKYSHNIFWSTAAQLIASGSVVLMSAIISRTTNASILGEFLTSISIINLTSVFSVSGIREVILRAAAIGADKTYINATYFSMRKGLIFGTPALIIIGAIYYLFSSTAVGTVLIISSMLFPCYISLQAFQFFLKGKSKFKELLILSIIKNSIQLLSIYAIGMNSNNVILVTLAFLITEVLFNSIIFIAIKTKINPTSTIDEGWKSQSYTLTVMDLSSNIFGKADIIIMGLFHSPSVVALYGIVMKFMEMFFLIIKSSITAILPIFYKKQNIVMSYFYRFLPLMIILSIVLLPIVKYPIDLLYGSEFTPAVKYTQFYLIVLPVFFLSLISNHFLIKEKLNNSILKNKTSAMIIVLILYFILIPSFGILGGIIASIIYFLLQYFLNIHTLNIFHNKKLNRY